MIIRNFNLKNYNTFGFSVNASIFASPRTLDELITLISSGATRENKTLILGGGSNILFTGDFDGFIINPVIMGLNARRINDEKVRVTAGAGVIWDDMVSWSVSNGFGGTENLSLIPGHTGAVAVQNIGAYGVEAAEIIEKVYCVDIKSGEEHELSNDECRFGYRDSIFKSEFRGRFVITGISFILSLKHNPNLGYGVLKEETRKLGDESLKNIRTAVINIRQSKLPDPAVIGNAGSFFKNPVIPETMAGDLKKSFPTAPCYDAGNGLVKVAAGWLIEQCGWKGFRRGDAGVYEKQALVLVNYGNASGKQIVDLAAEISESVRNKFGISLYREVEVI